MKKVIRNNYKWLLIYLIRLFNKKYKKKKYSESEKKFINDVKLIIISKLIEEGYNIKTHYIFSNFSFYICLDIKKDGKIISTFDYPMGKNPLDIYYEIELSDKNIIKNILSGKNQGEDKNEETKKEVIAA